ncbi:MAG TPA: thioredoxin domain-containing protein, partial [Acidimicrobiales bacterium]|nr:thioredoxin domain-containing protein [Acidimicrobiales bacterium]
MTVDATDATFETDVLARSEEVPVVVDLWAPWCGPCRTLGPIIEKVVDETDGKVALVKVNIDENPMISGSFRVQSIPAVFVIKD